MFPFRNLTNFNVKTFSNDAIVTQYFFNFSTLSYGVRSIVKLWVVVSTSENMFKILWLRICFRTPCRMTSKNIDSRDVTYLLRINV